MNQRRRTLLKTLGANSVVALAGCASSDDENDQENDNESTGEENDDEVATDVPTEQVRKLTPDDGDDDDRFGSSAGVSRDGSTAIIGATWDEDPNGEKAGSAYVFSRSGGTWEQQAKLAADDGDGGDRFGDSVGMSGDGSIAIIGTPIDEDPNSEAAGSVYVFSQSGGTWDQQAKLAADDGDADDRFGSSVGVSGDGSTAIIGANFDEGPNGDEGQISVGSAYVFSQSGGTWSQQAKLAADDANSSDNFGTSVGMSGDGSTAIIGAPNDEDPNGKWSGSAYVFSQSGGTWSQQAKLAADDGGTDDRFGSSIGVSRDGSTAIIGAPNDEDPNGSGDGRFSAGSAYVFSQSGGTWEQQAKLAADDGDGGDAFGKSVGVSGDGSAAIIAAYRDEDPNGKWSGSAYVFDI